MDRLRLPRQPEELAAIDQALTETARGQVASEGPAEAAFARFRK